MTTIDGSVISSNVEHRHGRRAILVGAGAMGKAWAKTLIACPDTTIAAWVDLQPDTAARAADEAQITPWIGTTLDAALRDVAADFVVDVTIPEAHHDVTCTALAAGLPVIGEKPMASSMAQAHAMVAASEKAGLLYMVSQSRRYDPGVVAYRDLIASELGTLGLLNVDFYNAPHFVGFRAEMPSPLILDMAIHTFDAARYLANADPISVYCEQFNPAWSWFKGASSATALFQMTGDVRFTYRGSWVSEGMFTTWEGDWRAVGEHGSARWDGENLPHGEIVAGSGDLFNTFVPVQRPLDSTIHRGIAGSLRDFLDALQTGKTPHGECHDNIKSLAMVFSAIESAAAGRRVLVEI